MTENDLKINLEELTHQREAVEAIINNFPEIDLFSKYDKNGLPSEYLHANPLIKMPLMKIILLISRWRQVLVKHTHILV